MGGNLHNALGTNKSSSAGNNNNNQSSAGSGTNPDEPVDLNLLADIPAWLRSLRLHKYTPNFDGSSTWQEMILMTNTDLENKGVAALGARRKLLKVFENIRNAQGIPVSSPLAVVPAGPSTKMCADCFLRSPLQHPPGSEIPGEDGKAE